jgi:hypothetical protein
MFITNTFGISSRGVGGQQIPPLRFAPVGMTILRAEIGAASVAHAENCRSLGFSGMTKGGVALS